MCLIIDANMAHKFGTAPHDDVLPVISILLDPRVMARVCVGGRLRTELLQSGQPMRDLLATLDRAGRLFRVDDEKVAIEEKHVAIIARQHNIRGLDDAHIIALAHVSGIRLLASHDVRSKLHAVFTDTRFIKPKGKVYRNRSHAHLLGMARDCGLRGRRR